MHPRVKGFLLFLAFFVLAYAIAAILSWLVFDVAHAIDMRDRSWRPSLFILFEGCSAAGALIAAWIVARLGKRSVASLGYRIHGALRQIAIGSVCGLAAVTMLVGAIWTFGGYVPGPPMMHGSRLAGYALAWLAAMFGIGIAEEATFRGAGMFELGDAIGLWPAAIVISLLFGAIHYFGKGPTENVADGLSVTLLGLFMSVTVIRTGAIWFATGFHALFDFAALVLFGAPNSGNQGHPLATRLFRDAYHGAPWLTGGPLGVEASWLVFPIIALLFVGFHFSGKMLGYNPRVPEQKE
jgi:CAAX protease family protein